MFQYLLLISMRILVGIAGFFQSNQVDQFALNRIVSSVQVHYDVLDNLQTSLADEHKNYRAQVSLTNRAGRDAIWKGDWALYFCHIRMIEEEHTAHNPRGYILPGGYGIRVTHINGCLFKFEPTVDFKPLEPHQTLRVPFNASYWCVSKTDVMPNWYVAADGLQARTITSTAGEDLAFVGSFDEAEKWKRFPSDRYKPYTPEKRYIIGGVRDLKNASYHVIPTPAEFSVDHDIRTAYFGTGDWIVVAAKELGVEARFLAKKLGIYEVTTGASNRVFRLILLKVGEVVLKDNKTDNPEAYSLDVDNNKMIIEIVGASSAGVFWGIQTLLSITTSGRVPHVTIRDAPRYEYRGMHLDMARNFIEKKEVLKLVDVMAMYKLNKLHMHLTDDEGWRLQIPDLPELTEIGGRRCHDPQEKTCVASQLGSGPFTGNSGSGYYTVKDYREILEYAEERHIQIIPEFDMPGHAHAAIKAMDARAAYYTSQGDINKGRQYLLSEENDTSKYLSAQNFKDNSINPCLESTYSFIEHIVDAVKNLHNDTQPLNIFHFGGYEVPHGAWRGSPACKRLAKKRGWKFSNADIVKNIKGYFVRRVSDITSSYNIDLAAWEDGLLGEDEKPYNRSYFGNANVYANTWDNVWEDGVANRPYKLANAGYKVIMTQATHLFFDHPYEPDPEERGYYWAPRFIDTRKTFGFMPDDLYANADFKRNGEPIKDLCDTMYQGKCIQLEKSENIVGMSGALWSETIRTHKQLDSLIHPRLLALAERAWHKAAWEHEKEERRRERMKDEDWERFANTLGYKELARLDEYDVAYHLPPPGARVTNGKLQTNVFIPGLRVQYTTDDGKTWSDVSDEVVVTSTIYLGTRSADRRRISRLVEINTPKEETNSPSDKPSLQTRLLLLLVLLNHGYLSRS